MIFFQPGSVWQLASSAACISPLAKAHADTGLPWLLFWKMLLGLSLPTGSPVPAQGQPSELSQGHCHDGFLLAFYFILFFFKRKNSHRWAWKGEPWVWATENQSFQSILWPCISSAPLLLHKQSGAARGVLLTITGPSWPPRSPACAAVSFGPLPQELSSWRWCKTPIQQPGAALRPGQREQRTGSEPWPRLTEAPS